ncbi:DeoR/GlpR family DNA-binding transcription regulator [Nitratireductor sp. StC3]|uniref:DeoR/GlpR family DNA-binding transcription regulator n=1 Tax=Nitratireductor sp. StC3 TaxID=2126741 RepID=UPI000D0D62B5|nr:DeoR/GlpR family DNA-binding transcription regulator [Nitratireductor sp. StC3]PSM15927.1 DeoR/GlpR transcriptional regulator [Nitratireductor sp. StC3]
MSTRKFTPEARRTLIMDYAREQGRILVEDLTIRFGASSETIRRDLNHLAAIGALRKFHGGACLPSLTEESPFAQRMASQPTGKRSIARAVVRSLTAGDTLFIDTGTTTLMLAEEMQPLTDLSVVTNSTAIAATLAHGNNSIYLLGGLYQPDAGETTGEITIEQIANFRASHAILTAGAVHPVNGMMDFSLGEAQVARAMIEQADHLVVLADRTKLGRSAFAKVCPLSRIDRLVTDAPPPDDLADALRAANVDVVIAE